LANFVSRFSADLSRVAEEKFRLYKVNLNRRLLEKLNEERLSELEDAKKIQSNLARLKEEHTRHAREVTDKIQQADIEV